MNPWPQYCLGAGDLLCRIASAKRNIKNVDRNLRSVITKARVALRIEWELVRTTVQLRKPRMQIKEVFWPCFKMQSWVETLVREYPEIIFGGFRASEESQWRRLFAWFWDLYSDADHDHPLFELQGQDRSLCIPYMTHGDEGRGLRSQAFMVESWQLVIGHLGPYVTNTSGFLAIYAV